MLLPCIHVLTVFLSLAHAFPPKRSPITTSISRAGSGNDIPSLDSFSSDSKSIGGTGSVGKKELINIRGGGGAFQQLVTGFKARMAYDSSFITKIGVEMIVGFTTQVAAEIAKRGANSLAEIDFIIAE